MNKFPLHVLLSAAGRMKGSSSTHTLDVLINSFPRGFGGFFPAPCTGWISPHGAGIVPWISLRAGLHLGAPEDLQTLGFQRHKGRNKSGEKEQGRGAGRWEMLLVGNVSVWRCRGHLWRGDKHLTLTYTPPRLQIFQIFPFPVEGSGFTRCVPYLGTATWDWEATWD